MTNHLHAAIQVSEQRLSGLMCWLGSRYARHVNRSLGRTGHLFERRHCAKLVTDDGYLLNLIRYIHMNPVEAGLVVDPGEYRWSSHRCYLGREATDWVTTQFILKCFSHAANEARQKYQVFMSIKSDWTPMDAESTDADNDTILADDPFSTLGQSWSLNPSSASRLDVIVSEICAAAGLEPATVKGPGRKRDATHVRGIICSQALARGIATLSQLAEYFGRAPEVISRGIARHGDSEPQSGRE